MRKIFSWILFSCFLTGIAFAKEEIKMKPFILAYKTAGETATIVEEVKGKLTAGGFQILGSYTPYDNTTIIGITNELLRKATSLSELGGFAAAQRVSVVNVGKEIQVSYTNPVYMSHAYRMKTDLKDVADQLKTTLGTQQEFGIEEGLDAEDLRDYSYTFAHPGFDQPVKLAEYASYEEALQKVEAGLKEGKYGATKVYSVTVDGKQETLFGVALGVDNQKRKDGSDVFIMKEIDFQPTKSAAHLPYDILVSGKTVFSLPAEFRIAINFPDLSMMGDNSFMNIMDCPDVIAETLAHTAGNVGYEH